MPSNGSSGEVDYGLETFGVRVKNSGLRIPDHGWQLSRVPDSGAADFGRRANQSSQIVALMAQAVDNGGSDQARGTGNQYSHSRVLLCAAADLSKFID